MVANQIGLNQIFPIYNEDGTSFHNLVLRKGVVDSIVMSLGDKITGDVFYKNNTLQVTMKEYVVYNGTHYSLVNPPTIVREGMVADNGELKGMTKYSFEFYHPMYQLSNFPFTDVATKTGEEKYLSQNKTFSWIGKPQDYIDKLNKNLQGTVWYVRKSDRFPVEKDGELSDVQQFDNVSVAEAIKRGYEIWGTPYIVSQLTSNDPLYAQGKRFVVEYGLPSNEIYESESARQLDTPYVFQMGQGVGLKNNSRTPRNNKIVTRIAGFGSEDNVPYGYPQIVWTGNQDWDYTINNDPNNPLSYPIYKGIVGGQYVKLIKHPFTRTHLMPSIFTETVNKKVNPNAVGYDPTIEIKDYYDAVATQEYPYVNEINLQAPSYESHEFAEIKPELDADRNTGIVSAVPLNADLTPADHWDDSMDDDGNYLQSYFQITLPQLSFDLYACAAITQEMQINMRSGACIGCTFTVQVDWEDYKRNFYDEDGNFVPDGEQRDLTKYPKSNLGQISVVVQKDNSTFGTLMPNIYQQPKANDLFVFIGISLPLSYIANAEERLDDAMKTYMLENNVFYFDYPLKFDEHFLATHTYILEQIRPNSIIHFDYGGVEQQLFVKQLTVKYGNAPLPQYDITLTDNIEVVLNQIGQVADDVEKLSSLIAILRQSYNRNVWNELAKKLSKTQDDTAQGFIRFMQGLQVGSQFVSGILGEGGVFRKDADGKTYIEADKMYVRMKAYFDSVEIREYQHTSGNRIASQAKGFTVSRVEWLDANGDITDNINNVVKFRCYWRAKDDEHEVQNQFVVGDQAFMEYSDIVDGNLIQKRFWRVVTGRNVSVTEDGEAWIDLSNKASDTITYIDHQGVSRTKTVQGYENGSDIPQPEDDICQLGNVWDSERQGAIIEYVSGADAPTYQIYQGINSYSLNEKNQIALGYSSQTGRAHMNVYGDMYVGEKGSNPSTYIRYTQEHKEWVTPEPTEEDPEPEPVEETVPAKLEIKAVIDASSPISGSSSDPTTLGGVLSGLQNQIDGAIETYYMTGEPSLSLPPVISTQAHPYNNPWLDGTETPAERTKILNNHVGDLYYDKATGRGYRFMYDDENQVFLWTELTDADVAEALRIANEAKDTVDGKRTVYSVWGAWVKNGVNTLEVGDLFIPASDTTQGGVVYKANKVYKCTTKGSAIFQEVAYTDDSTFNGYISAILNGSGSSGDAATVAAAQKAIKDALGGGTTVDGGLLLTSLIAMRKYKGSGSTTDIANYDTWSGISGLRKDTETGTGWKGYGIAAWYGGAMVDHEVSTTATDYAKSLFRFDGSGYLASGNITWDKDGRVAIKDITTLIGSSNTNILNELTTFNNAFHFNTQQGTTTVLSIVPQAGFTSLNITENGTLKPVATQEWVGNNYLSIAFFNRLFQTYNGTTRVNANDTTSTIDNIKAMFGFWTEKYISALGKNTSGGGGGGGDIDMTTVWSALANNTNEQINLSHLTTALSGYATQSWVYQQLTGGTVTAVKVGTTTYSPTNGVVSLPAYPSTLDDIADGSTRKLANYLPLSGGTVTGKVVISAANYLGQLTIKRSDSANDAMIRYENSSGFLGAIGIHANKFPYYTDDVNGNNVYTLWHAGNDGSGSGLDADLLDGQHGSYYAVASSLNNYLPLSGGVMTGNISFKGSGSTYQMIKFKSSADAYGQGLVLGGGGLVAIGGGESQDVMAAQCDGSDERTLIGNDGDVEIYTALQNGWDSRHSFIFNTNGMLTMDGGQSKAYYLTVTNGSNTSNYWHKLGTFVTAGHSRNLVINIYSGDGYNGEARQNSYARIIIKDGYQSTSSVTNCLGITCERYGNASQIQVRVNVTKRPNLDSATGDVWVLLPWNYANSNYTIEGDFASWNHNSSTSGDTTTPPTHNQGEVMYLDNAYLTSNVASATKLQTPRTLWGQSFDGTGNVDGNITVTGNGYFTGNVGIGTTSPSYTLHVSGSLYCNAFTGGLIEIPRNNNVIQSVAGYHLYINHQRNSNVFLCTGGGNVGIGTTSTSYKLNVAGVIYSTTGIFSDGYVSALGQNTSSDIRKKDIKENIALSVEDIAAAPMIKYEWKDNRDLGMQVGSIAQYWESVLPESIHDDKDGFKSMQYGVIALLSSISVARKVQDHERRIKELEKENERLRTEVEQLRLS